ncbi:unnamed protein product [Linum trigynum]|uniref:Leucine-rich repeat-containing N-terminal plant-type domain-containing protein n=1 Tax=Linum trigynum TaxID=586398 RepID=A0AAV2FE20_9ROSI
MPSISSLLPLSLFLSSLLILNTLALNSLHESQPLQSSRRSRGRTKSPKSPLLPPPPSPSLTSPPPPPSPAGRNPQINLLTFADARLATVYPVIQKFKSTITSDPLNITASWVGSDICTYRGFFCDSPPDNASATAVASIDFNGFGLSAPSLDGFLDRLPDIALFHANSNSFAGTISSAVAALPYLYELDISNNLFTGPFPTAVLGMTGLTFLDIRFNSFSGAVPPQIFVQNLEALFLNDNQFMTNLPPNLANTRILYLTLANNKFTGSIPGSIFKAFVSLTEVLLLNNQLTGCLPYEVGMLNGAVVFDVGSNRLTGPIPLSLMCLEKVEQLNLGGNQFYGILPDLLCSGLAGLGNLVNLTLSGNYFTGVGRLCMDLIMNGVLDLTGNCIPGFPFQRPVQECAEFFAKPRMLCPRPWSYTYVPCTPFSGLIHGLAPTP